MAVVIWQSLLGKGGTIVRRAPDVGFVALIVSDRRGRR
jgi:hypothetical protein